MKTLPSQPQQDDSRVIGGSWGNVHEIDPLTDPRWQTLVERHPNASIFHSVAWLDALRRTYGWRPVVFTSSKPTCDLENGLLFCAIRSWIAGNHLVSLPFSEYCSPLCDAGEEFDSLVSPFLSPEIYRRWKYLQIRPLQGSFGDTLKRLRFKAADSYVVHQVDLEPAAEVIFRRLDKNCVQGRVRHAERAGISEVCGKSERILDDFYRLVVRTRTRHNLLPQPYSWFRNILQTMGEGADLRLAYLKEVPVAGVLTLNFKGTSYYHHGCSDERFHDLGAMPFLLFHAMLKAKSAGAGAFDLGRTHNEQHGLMKFKNHWTNRRHSLTYWTFPPTLSLNSVKDWKLRIKRVCHYMPPQVLTAAGSLLYRHAG